MGDSKKAEPEIKAHFMTEAELTEIVEAVEGSVGIHRSASNQSDAEFSRLIVDTVAGAVISAWNGRNKNPVADATTVQVSRLADGRFQCVAAAHARTKEKACRAAIHSITKKL